MLAFSCNLTTVGNCQGLVSSVQRYLLNDQINSDNLDKVSDIYLKMCTGELDSNMSEESILRYCSGIQKNQQMVESNKAKKFKTLVTSASDVAEEDKRFTVFESLATAYYDTDEVYEIELDELSLLKELDEISEDIIVTTGFDLKKCLFTALDGSLNAISKLKEVVLEENIGELITDILNVSDLRQKLSY